MSSPCLIWIYGCIFALDLKTHQYRYQSIELSFSFSFSSLLYNSGAFASWNAKKSLCSSLYMSISTRDIQFVSRDNFANVKWLVLIRECDVMPSFCDSMLAARVVANACPGLLFLNVCDTISLHSCDSLSSPETS